MPPRRRTFYLADATLLSNPKILRLKRLHPDDWLSVVGAFHLLIGVATLNGSPRLSKDDIEDVLGGHATVAELLRSAGLMTRTGIDRATFEEWTPKPRPKYPSDGGVKSDSDGVEPDSAVVGTDSAGIKPIPSESDGMPTSSTSSSSVSTAASSSSSRGVKPTRPTALSGAAGADDRPWNKHLPSETGAA